MKNKIIITVESGVVTSVCDAKGKELQGQIVIIDFDNQKNGDCPVCQEELELIDNNFHCSNCGYNEAKDNAFKCAVKLSKG